MTSNDNFYGGKRDGEINLKDYFSVIKKRLWIIVIITIIAASSGYLYSKYNNAPVYQSSTRVIIESDSEYMKTLMVMIKDPLIMEKVRDELKLSRPAETIANQVEVTRMDESQVVKIDVIDKSPELAVRIANTTASVFKTEVGKILKFEDVQLLSAAKETGLPINQNRNRTMIITSIFGLITGVGLVFLLDSLDNKVREETEIEAIMGVPVLGVINNMDKRKFAVKTNVGKEMKLRGDTVDIKQS